MALFMSNICRLCMARKEVLIPLFSKDNRGQTLSLPDKIMNFVPVIKVHRYVFSAYSVQESEVSDVSLQFVIYFQLFVGDGLPAQICEPCVRLVNTSYRFKVQCETTDTALRQYLNTHSLQVVARNSVH
jgi:hypothetical protein